jgi:hypothetical protein
MKQKPMMPEKNMKVQLRDNATGQVVIGTLTVFKAKHQKMWEEQWKKALDKGRRSGPNNYPDAEWDWSSIFKAALKSQGSKGYCIIYNGKLQGVLFISFTNRMNLQDSPVVYVDYLASAPWNRVKGEISFVGFWLIYRACQLSKNLGFGGRLALSSEPGAEQFYNEKIKMQKKGKNKEGETYFELDENGCQTFMALFEEIIQKKLKQKS